jgi:hypothetical protein
LPNVLAWLAGKWRGFSGRHAGQSTLDVAARTLLFLLAKDGNMHLAASHHEPDFSNYPEFWAE